MENQISTLSANAKRQYVIKRIGDADIIITVEERNKILASLAKGSRFILVDDHILMLNGIKSVDPLIPPKPKPQYKIGGINFTYPVSDSVLVNEAEIKEWESTYGRTAR